LTRSKKHKLPNEEQLNPSKLDFEEEHYLPPRTAIHPSEKGKWTKVFYQTLLWLFISLVIGLTIWGINLS
jgi:hypothetical protein